MNRFVTSFVFLTWLSFSPPLLGDEPPLSGEQPPLGGVETPDAAASRAKSERKWKSLESKWVSCNFGGDGEISIEPAKATEPTQSPTPRSDLGEWIKVGLGDPLTGARWSGEAPTENFELELEARRTEGFDFFCGLTFPVGESHVTFVLGGWGGGVVGISNIDGLDASENEQTYYQTFKNDEWQKIRVRVDPEQIQCWINDKISVEQPRKDHRFDLRYEMEVCRPIGMAAYMCKAEYRNMRIRELTKKDLEDAKKAAETRAAEDDE